MALYHLARPHTQADDPGLEGGELVRTFHIACALFFVIGLAAVIVKMKSSDYSKKPSMNEMEKISSEFYPRQFVKRKQEGRINRKIFFGYSTTRYYDSGVDAIAEIYDTHAKNQALKEKLISAARADTGRFSAWDQLQLTSRFALMFQKLQLMLAPIGVP